MTAINEIFLAQNPWQADVKWQLDKFINRDLFEKVLPWMDSEEVVTIVGPRQAGKTTLLFRLIEWLKSEKNVTGSSIFYFNFDMVEVREQFSNPQQVYHFVKSKGDYQRYWLFLDEVQRLDDAGLWLKVLQDLPGHPIKLVISGSSSLQLRAKIKEHLTGRQMEFHLWPLSLSEIYQDRGYQKPVDNMVFGKELIEQYGLFGGYPKPYQIMDVERKIMMLSQLYRDYVKRDVVEFAKVENVAIFNALTKLLAYQVGNLINKEELSSSSQGDVRTVTKYLEILEETFVIKLLPPYFTNRRKEIVKSPKVFWLDNGLRNVVAGGFDQMSLRPDKGSLLENLILSELVKTIPENIELRYWRTQAGAEVDFVLVKGKELLPIEVKYGCTSSRISKSFKSFLENYSPARALVVSMDYEDRKSFGKTNVLWITPGKLSKYIAFAETHA